MAFPESSDWTLEGKEAAEFTNKLFQKKEKRPLLTSVKLSDEEAYQKALDIARKLKK